MSIDKIDHPWGETGSLDTTLTDDKRDVGWVSGDSPDRPTVERFNLIQNEVDNKLNEMLYKGPKTWNESATMKTVLTGVNSSSDAGTLGYDSHNEMDSGDVTDEFVCIALAVVDGTRKAIALDQSTPLNVEIFDIDGMMYDGPQSIPASSLPQDGGDEDWRAGAIVCDESYVYILFQDWGASSTYHYHAYVQSYSISNWSVKPGWPSTGLFLFDNGAIQNADNMIFATDDLLAIYDEDTTITGGSSRSVILVDTADGTENSSGSGDLGSSFVRNICSNGTYVFISTATHIGSMLITSPSTGCGGTGWPRSGSGSNGMACLGDVVYGSGATVSYVLHVDNANIATITPNPLVIPAMGDVVTDGFHFWIRGRLMVGSASRMCFVHKVDITGLMQEDSSTPVSASEEIFSSFAISLDDGTYTSKIMYDGDGIVGVLDFNGDGRLFKLPKTSLR